MVKFQKKGKTHVQKPIHLYNPFLLFQFLSSKLMFKTLMSNSLSFFLLLSCVSFLLQLVQVITMRSLFDDFLTIFSLSLLILAFLISLLLICLIKRLKTLPQRATLMMVAIFLGVHFYILLFVIESRLDFALINSLIVWNNALKTTRRIENKAFLLLPLASLLIWKLELFFHSTVSEILLFATSIFLVLIKKNMKTNKVQRNISDLVIESAKSKSDFGKNPPQNEPIQLLGSLQEAVLIFTPDLKLKFSNPYISSLIANYASLSPTQIESEILSFEQDEKSIHINGLAFRDEAEFGYLINAFKSKMALFSSSVTEFNEENKSRSSTSNFTKRTIKSMLSSKKRLTHKMRAERDSLMDCSKIKDPNENLIKDIEKNKLGGVHFLNKNAKYSQVSQKSMSTDMKTMRDILKSALASQWTEFVFFAKAKDPDHILFVNLGIIETGVLVVIKNLNRKDPLFNAWDFYKGQNNLLASMCHELRTPLNSITNMLELMDGIENDNESFSNHTQREYLSSAILNSKLLQSSINDFLDYFSLSGNMFETKSRVFNIRKLLLECDSIFRAFAMRKNVNFYLHISKLESYNVCNDEVRIKQIIINLLNNAFKFTLSGGSIILKLKLRSDFFEVIVRDTGIGIDLSNFKSQTSYLTSKTNAGSNLLGGFGLMISNILVNYIGPKEETGKIYKGMKLRTEKDKGSRFSFLIDKKKADLEETESFVEFIAIEKKVKNIDYFKSHHPVDYHFFRSDETISPASPNIKCHCRKILAVDDNGFNLLVLDEQFKKQNIFIDTCPGGVEAVNLVEEILLDTSIKFCQRCQFYKLILMDIDMPIKNGYETTMEINDLLKDTNINVKVVALSAFSQEEAKEKASAAGIVDYIEKPFSKAKMEYLISNYL